MDKPRLGVTASVAQQLVLWGPALVVKCDSSSSFFIKLIKLSDKSHHLCCCNLKTEMSFLLQCLMRPIKDQNKPLLKSFCYKSLCFPLCFFCFFSSSNVRTFGVQTVQLFLSASQSTATIGPCHHLEWKVSTTHVSQDRLMSAQRRPRPMIYSETEAVWGLTGTQSKFSWVLYPEWCCLLLFSHWGRPSWPWHHTCADAVLDSQKTNGDNNGAQRGPKFWCEFFLCATSRWSSTDLPLLAF